MVKTDPINWTMIRKKPAVLSLTLADSEKYLQRVLKL